uniref:Putative 58. protein in lys 3'region n=1 Tax=Anthurium amnicola TaxID=1678845 RepID=A0A1D1XSG9_9ARAE
MGVGPGKKNDKETGDLQTVKAGEAKEAKDEGGEVGSGGDSSSKVVGNKDNAAHVEECDAPNRCVDEKNKFVACLRVPGNDAPTLSLLIQNKGTGSLTVNILAPDYVSLEDNVVLLQAEEDKKVKISVEFGVNNTPIILSAGDGRCNLSFWDMIPSSIKRTEGYSVPSHINIFMQPTFIYLALAAVVLLAAAWFWVRFQRMRQLVDPRYQKLDGGLPLSSGGVTENDIAGWDNSWEGSWDDEEAPKTPSKSLSNLSSKGLASRRSNKDGWKD